MTINRLISVGVLWCFCLCNSVQAQDIKVPLAHLKGHRYASSLSPSATALLRKQAAILDTKDSFPAILHLWIAGETEYIELLWWRKDDRETRAFIVALFYCRYFVPEDDSALWPDIIPDFSLDATRFACRFAVESLGKIGPAAACAVPDLEALLDHKNPYFRISLSVSLMRLDPKSQKALAALKVLLQDPDSEIRRKTVSSLEDIGPEAAPAKALVKVALKDSDPDVRDIAARVLRAVGKQ